MHHLGAAVPVGQVVGEHLGVGERPGELLDARSVRAVAASDEERVVVEPERVAAVDRSRRLDSPRDGDACAGEVGLEGARLAEPPVLAGPEEHGTVVADKQRVVRVDGVRVARLAVGDDHLGAGLLEELAQRLVLGGRGCRIRLQAPAVLPPARGVVRMRRPDEHAPERGRHRAGAVADLAFAFVRAHDLPVSIYHDGNRRLQDRFDTRRLADRIEERKVRDWIDAGDRAFIEARDMFFLATADADGAPQCSYKGGDPGFVRVLDEHTIAFPGFDGNGMYLSLGNVLANPRVGLLFVDFEGQRRLRLNGIASIDLEDPLLAEYPRAQCVVRVRATEVFPNCPRYIHKLELVERSRFTPRADHEPPVPDWKRRDWARDVLPAGDPASDA